MYIGIERHLDARLLLFTGSPWSVWSCGQYKFAFFPLGLFILTSQEVRLSLINGTDYFKHAED